MCDKTRTAVEVIKAQKRKTLTKEETLMLFKEVIEDNEKMGEKITVMGERMTNLEKRMESLENKMDAGFADIKKLIEDSRRMTLFEKIMALSTHKYFWITLIITLLIIGGILGVSPSGFNSIVTLGG